MLKWNIVFVSCVLFVSCAVKDEHPIIGEWHLTSSSFILSESCSGATIRFTTDDLLLSNSGSLQEIKSYTVKPYKNGFLVVTQHISDNNKKNCQGIPAIFARKYPISKVYLEVLNEGQNLKMHFHPEKSKGFLIVEKLLGYQIYI